MNSKAFAESKFAMYCKMQGLPEPEREYRFDPERKWRFDFSWPDAHVAVEIEGVTKWGGLKKIGRHQTPKGVAADCEKYNKAVINGWAILRYTQDMLNLDAVHQVQYLIDIRRNKNGLGS